MTVTINSNNFNDLEGFYNEIDRVLTQGLDWRTGHNLNAFNDILRGGFGVHEYEEPIKLIWNDANKSKRELSKIIDGKTLFDILVEIIQSNEHIEFIEA